MSSLDTVQALIAQNKIAAVRFELVDLHGVGHCRLIASRHFRDKAVNGARFSLEAMVVDPKGNPFTDSGVLESNDAIVYPVYETFQVLVWAQSTARILVEPTFNEGHMPQHPRYVARKQLDRLAEYGLSLFSSNVHEFYLVDEKTGKAVEDGHNYAACSRMSKSEAFINLMLACLPRVGVDVESIDLQSAPGQIRVTYKPAFGIGAADNAHTFRSTVKELAQKNGYIASFMSKPWTEHRGSSAFFCHSLWSQQEHKNVVCDATSETALSSTAQKWVAGILAHAQAITALLAPTVNCYGRIESGSLAPTTVSWGLENRTCAIRAKIKTKGSLLENRIPSSGSNPYIVMAATVAAGMDGLLTDMLLKPGVDGDAYDLAADLPELPTTLHQALEVLQSDTVIVNALGKDFIGYFVAAKNHEIRLADHAERGGNESWEHDTYFDTI